MRRIRRRHEIFGTYRLERAQAKRQSLKMVRSAQPKMDCLFFNSNIEWRVNGCFMQGTSGKGGVLDWYWNGCGMVPLCRAIRTADGSHQLDFVH